MLRSNHPAYSFLAWGKYAKLIVEKHPLHFGLSKDSPLSKIVDLNGFVLLAGMNYDKCEMFDLAPVSYTHLGLSPDKAFKSHRRSNLIRHSFRHHKSVLAFCRSLLLLKL